MKKDLFRSLKKIGPESRGLVPTIVQDWTSREVLMVAFMDKRAFEATLLTGESHFHSRSRKALWHKGEESGHTQRVREIYIDCDADTLLLRVEPKSPACHTGNPTCFFTKLSNGRPSRAVMKTDSKILERVFDVIEGRRKRPSKSSYVSRLFSGGEDRVLKKVGEEAGEFLLASKGRKKPQVVREAADLLFHVLVALSHQGIPLQKVFNELEGRFGLSGLEEKEEGEAEKGEEMKGCLFCRIIRREIPSKIVHEDDHAISFQDINPQAPVHLLILPKKHIERLSDAAPEDQALLGHLFLTGTSLAREMGIAESGFRMVINSGEEAGQTVFHLHLHLMGGRPFYWPPG